MIRPQSGEDKSDLLRGDGKIAPEYEYLKYADPAAYQWNKMKDDGNIYVKDIDERIFAEAARRGEKELLINAINKNVDNDMQIASKSTVLGEGKTGDISAIDYINRLKPYNDYIDYDAYMLSLEMPFLDNENKKPRTDESGNYNFGNFTDREWAEMILDSDIQRIEGVITEEKKKTQNFFVSLGVGIGDLTVRLVGSVTGFISDIYNIGEGLLNIFVDSTEKNIGTRFLKAFDNGDALEKAVEDLEEVSYELERDFTCFVDASTGEVTTVGKYWRGITDVVGYMLPVIGWGKLATTGAKVGTQGYKAIKKGNRVVSGVVKEKANLSKLSGKIFYTGIASSNIKNSVEYANNNGISLSQLNAGQIIANAAIKAVAQYAIEKITGKLLGSSQLDRMIGTATKGARAIAVGEKVTSEAVKKAGIANIVGKTEGSAVAKYLGVLGKDAIKEGIEETLQELSDGLFDTLFGKVMNEQTAAAMHDEHFSIETLVDSFVIGALTSILMGFGANMKYIPRSNRAIGVDETGKAYRMGAFQSMNFSRAMQMLNEWNDVLNDRRSSEEDKMNAATRLSFLMSTVGDVISNIGEKRAIRANALLMQNLDNMAREEKLSKMSNVTYAKNLCDEFFKGYKESAELYNEQIKNKIEKEAEKLADELKTSGTTKFDDIITVKKKADDLSSQEKIDELLKAIKAQAIVTTDGSIITKSGDIAFVNTDYLKEKSNIDIIQQLGYKDIEKAVANALNKNQKQFAVRIYRVATGYDKTTIEEVVRAILFDKNFYAKLLLAAGESKKLSDETFSIFPMLDKIIEREANIQLSNRTISDDVHKTLLEKARANIRAGLINYATQCAFINVDMKVKLDDISVQVLDTDTKRIIREHPNYLLTNKFNTMSEKISLLESKNVDAAYTTKSVSKNIREELSDLLNIEIYSKYANLLFSNGDEKGVDAINKLINSENINDLRRALECLRLVAREAGLDKSVNEKVLLLPMEAAEMSYNETLQVFTEVFGNTISELRDGTYKVQNIPDETMADIFAQSDNADIAGDRFSFGNYYDRLNYCRQYLYNISGGTLTFSSNFEVLKVLTAEEFFKDELFDYENAEKYKYKPNSIDDTTQTLDTNIIQIVESKYDVKTKKVEKLYLRDFIRPELTNSKLADIEVVFDIVERPETNAKFEDGVITIYNYKNISSEILHEATHAMQQTSRVVRHDNLYAFGGSPDVFNQFDTDVYDDLKNDIFEDNPLLERAINYTSIKYKTDTTNYIFYCLLRGENEAMATIDLALVQSGYTYVWKDVPVGLMINGKYKPFKESKVKEMRKMLRKRNVLEKSTEDITLGEGDKEMVEKYEKDNARIRNRKAKARSRRFTKKRAEKSNLKYFYKKGIVNQLDDDVQDFVEATTAEFDKLPNEIKTQIIDGTLTKQSLLDFAATKNNINDYTFKMLAKHFFKNEALAELTYEDYKLLRDKYLLTAKTLYDFVKKKGRKLNKFKYHFSKRNFNKFERGDIGFHFSDIKQVKQRIKNLNEKDGYVYIIAEDIKQPYVVEHDLMQWYAEDFALYLLYGYDTFFNSGKKKSELISDLDKLKNNLPTEFKKYFEELKEIAKSDTASQSNAIRMVGRKKLVNIMKELGYDGIRYKNEGEEEGYTDIYFDVEAFVKLPIDKFESKMDNFLAEFDEDVDEQKNYEDLIKNLNAGEKIIDAENLTVSSNTANTNYSQLPFFKLYDGSIRSLRDIYRYVSVIDKLSSTFGWETKSIEEESLDDIVDKKSLLDLQKDIISYYSQKYIDKYAKDTTVNEGTYNKLLSTPYGQLLLGQMMYEYEEQIENGTFEASEFDNEGNIVGRTKASVYERPWDKLTSKEQKSYIPTTNWSNLEDRVKYMLILEFAEMFGKSRFNKLVAGLDVKSQAYRDKLEEEYFRTQAATITRLPIAEIGKVRRIRERPNVIVKEKIYNVANRLIDRIISKDRYDTLSDFAKKIITYKDGEFIIDMSATNEFDGRLNEMYETLLEDEYMLKSTISTSERLRGDKERLLRTIKTQMKQIEQAKQSDNQKRIEQLEGYLKKNREKLEKLEKRISKYTERELSERLKSAEKIKGFREKIEREKEKADKERKKRRAEETKDKSFREKVAPDIETRVKGEKFKFDSNQEPNNLVRHIIGTMFTRNYIQNVQNRESNSEIEKMRAKDFYEHNGNELLAASIEDIAAATEWFMNTEISKTDDISPVEWARTVRHYEIVRGLFLSLVLDYSTKNNMWSQLDANLRKQADLFYTTKTTLGSDFMNIQKESLRRNEPLTYMTANNLVFDGITIPDDLQKKLFDSISGKVMTEEKIKQMQEAQREIIDYIDARRSAKKSVLRRIASFRAVSMLSSPLTWLRNIVSNYMLKNLNRISEKIGNAMFKNKEYLVGQLSMTGDVKISFDKSTGKPIFKKGVTPEVQTYINENFFDNGLFQSIIENISKFSPTDIDDFSKDRLTGKNTTEGVFSTLILKNLYNQYYNNAVFKTKSVQKFFDFVMKRMNDTPWVREATIKYFAKILAERDYDLKNTTGITNEIANDFAIAISLGLKDYMHSDNVFNRLEKTLAEKEDTQAWWFAYKLFLPFASASWNWLKGAWKFTPMGLVRAIWNSIKLEKRVRRIKANVDAGKSDYIPELTEYLTRRDLGSGVVGTMLLAFGAALAWLGMIRLEDDDYGVPKLKIGSLVVNVSSIFGSSSLLYGASIVTMINKNGNFDDVMNNVGGLIVEGFPVMSMLETDVRGSGVFTAGLDNLQDIVLSFIPNLLTYVAKGVQIGQPNYQGNYVEKFLQRAAAKIPFLNLTLPRKIDIYTGRELYTSDSLMKTILEYNIWRLTPYFSLDLASQNENKTTALGLNKSMLKGQYVINDKEIKVTGNLLNELNRNYGKWNAEDLTKFYSNGMKVKVKTASGYKELSYNQMTPEQVKRAVQTIMSNNAEIAKIKAWTAKGNKYYASKNLYKTLQSRGIKTNVYRGTNGFVEK